jgi:flagellar hook-associated protein 2
MSDFRIGGLASGIDTNSLIDQLMSIERKSEQLLQTKKQKISWKKDLWSDIKSSLSALDSSTQAMLKRSSMLARNTSTSDEDVLTATSTSDAALSSYDINVTALATSSKLASGSGVSGMGISNGIDPDQPISKYTSKFSTNPTEGKFTINGVTFNLTDSDDDNIIDSLDVTNSSGTSVFASSVSTGITLNDIMTAFADDDVLTATGAAVAYSEATDKITVTASAPGGSLNMGSAGDTSNFLSVAGLLTAQRSGDTKTSVSHFGQIRTSQILANANFTTAITGDANGNGEFTINGVSIEYNKNTDTLKNVIDRINSSAAGVNANYDNVRDKLVLTNKATGSLSISRTDVTGNFLSAVDLLTGATETAGTNATMTISGVNNGNPIASASNTVTDAIEGVTLNLLKEGPATITVGQDTTKAKDAIKDFVTKYNATITLINDKLNEKTVDNPQSVYESKQGLLRGNRQLAEIKYNLVDESMTVIPGVAATLDELSDIGITIDKTDFGKSGNLVIDEAKLDEALADDPASVANLFFKDADGDGKIDKDDDDGVAAKFSNYLDGLLEKGGAGEKNRYEDSSTGIIFQGTWGTVTNVSASKETIKQSTTAGDFIEFTFTGSSIAWYAMKNSDLGKANVFIDGSSAGTIDLYSASEADKQKVFSKAGLSNGTHTIKIQVAGDKNDSSSGFGVNLDAFDIASTTSAGVLESQNTEYQADMDDIDEQVQNMEVRLEKYQQILIAVSYTHLTLPTN